MIEAFRNMWFTVPVAAIMLIADIIIAIIYTAYTFIAEWRFKHRGPRHERKDNSCSGYSNAADFDQHSIRYR